MNERVQAAIDAAKGSATELIPIPARARMRPELRACHEAIENVALVAEQEKRHEMLEHDESMETYLLYGRVQKDDGTAWSEDEGRAFSERFLTWLEDQGLGYGGLLGEPKKLEESMHSKRDAD